MLVSWIAQKEKVDSFSKKAKCGSVILEEITEIEIITL